MKIRKPEIETKYFEQLKQGDTFMFNNEMYMKIETVFWEGNYNLKMEAVNLETGKVRYIYNNTEVACVDIIAVMRENTNER